LYRFLGNSVRKPYSFKGGHIFTFSKVKHRYSASQKYIKTLIAEFCTKTFMISTILLYFFKNSSSRMFFICKMSFFKSFSEQLTFLMGGNLLSCSLKQSLSNSYRDSKSNLYSTKVISLKVAMLSALSLAIQDFFRVKHVLMQQ